MGIIIRNQKDLDLLFNKYKSFISEHYYDMLEDVILGIRKSVEIPDAELKEWDGKLSAYQIKDEMLMKTAELNNKGIAAEKRGDIESAIILYEENITLGYKATHAFNRLMVLYRKQKRYGDEIRVIERGIEVFQLVPGSDWHQRKMKVEGLCVKFSRKA